MKTMHTIETTPASVDPITAHHMRALNMITTSLFPRKVRTDLSRIRWLAGAQDGTQAPAEESLLAIEDLAADALAHAEPSA